MCFITPLTFLTSTGSSSLFSLLETPRNFVAHRTLLTIHLLETASSSPSLRATLRCTWHPPIHMGLAHGMKLCCTSQLNVNKELVEFFFLHSPSLLQMGFEVSESWAMEECLGPSDILSPLPWRYLRTYYTSKFLVLRIQIHVTNTCK